MWSPRAALVRRAGWLLGLAVIAVFCWVVLTRFGELGRLLELLRGLRPEWVALALTFQALTYACTPLLWWTVLNHAGHHRSLRDLLPLSLAKLFADNTIPTAGISGSAVIVRALGRREVPTPVALAVTLVDLLSYYGAYLVALAMTLGVLWWRHRVDRAVLALAAGLVALAVLVPLAVLLLTSPGRARRPRWFRRVRALDRLATLIGETPPALLRSPALLLQGTLLRLLVFLLDAATLGALLRGLGQPAGLATALAGFIVGSLAATLAPLPGGLGSFEGGAITTLSVLGVPPEAALAGTLLLRGMSFWAPLLPGLWIARRELAA
jgi:uncharacterized protein (TIRG00374 family)